MHVWSLGSEAAQRRNTQHESSLRTHTYQPQRFFFPAIHPNAPPLRPRSFRCEQLKPHTVRRSVEASAISWVPTAMAAVAAVQLWSTTAVAWVVRLCANVDGCPFHFDCVSKNLASWQNTRCSKGAHPKHPSEVGSRRACDDSQGGYRLEMPLPACDLSC